MGFAEEMSNLGEKLISSCDNRLSNERCRINDERKRAEDRVEFCTELASDTDKTLRRFRNDHKEMSKKQIKELAAFTSELTQNTKGYLRKCHKQQMELHDMFAQAHRNFLHCMREIERKKRHPSTRLEREEPRKTPRKKKRTRH